MKTVSIATLKGGVGKTTTAVTIASILATDYNKKVLLIDVDPQANSTSYMKIDETADSYLSIKNILENDNVPIESIVKETFIDNLYIIGSTILLTGTEMKLVASAAREFVLKRYFSKHQEYFKQYDYIIFDTNPSMNVVNQNVFIVSNSIILLTDVGIGAFKGVELFDCLWGDISDRLELQNNVKALILNKVKDRTVLAREYRAYLAEETLTSKLLLKAYIKDSIRFSEAELERKPINIYSPNCPGSHEYREVVKELFERNVI